MFFELSPKDFRRILPLYLREQIIFPLILAVVKQNQHGWVFVDNPIKPASAIIISNFGFMQFAGTQTFSNALMEFFKFPMSFIPSYLLWYSPPHQIQKVLDGFIHEHVRRRERVRFFFKKKTVKDLGKCPEGFRVQHLDKELIKEIQNFKLDIGSRFWTSIDEFLEHGIGTCIIKEGVIVSLCYSACVVDDLAEIDIVTQEEYRGMGLATIAAQNFLSECIRREITPTWDCFANNTASMKLAKLLGFKQIGIYSFYSFKIPADFSGQI